MLYIHIEISIQSYAHAVTFLFIYHFTLASCGSINVLKKNSAKFLHIKDKKKFRIKLTRSSVNDINTWINLER